MIFSEHGPNIPQSLLDEHAAGKVIFFVGAGLSCGAGLPNFRNLVSEVKKYFRFDDFTEHEIDGAIQNYQLDHALEIMSRSLIHGDEQLIDAYCNIFNTVNRSEYLSAHIFNFWLIKTSTNVL